MASNEATDETTQLHYTEIEDWEEWHAKLAQDLSVIVPEGSSADVTVTVGPLE